MNKITVQVTKITFVVAEIIFKGDVITYSVLKITSVGAVITPCYLLTQLYTKLHTFKKKVVVIF